MKNEKDSEKGTDCCKATEKKGEGLFAGIAYGLLPHTGCIAFVLFTVLGATAATSLFKPLLMNPYFFYGLIGLSLVFATISAAYYLGKLGMLSVSGARRKWKYLSVMYGSTIAVNLFMFMVVFPYAANIASASPVTGTGFNSLEIQVAIPCPGHAPLITDELKNVSGVLGATFSFPDRFNVTYDPAKVTEQQILGIDVFKTYKATVTGSVIKTGILQSSVYQENSSVQKTCVCGSSCSSCGSGGSCVCGSSCHS